MRVYAVCRRCAEVHLASGACPRCARQALLGAPAVAVEAGGPSVPAAEVTSLVPPARSRRWWWSTGLLAVYLVAILGLLAAALLAN